MKVSGLDIGTMFVVSAKPAADGTAIKRKRNCFIKIKGTNFNRNVYSKRTDIDWMPWGDEILLVGDSALSYVNSAMTPVEVRRPLKDGIINKEDRDSLPIVNAIVESVIGTGDGGVCGLSIPMPTVDKAHLIDHHQRVLSSILKKLGWTVSFIGEGMCVVYSELDESMYTGLGVSGGAGMVNVCLSSMGEPQFQFSMQQAGDWVDMAAAEHSGLTMAEITDIKETDFSLLDENLGKEPQWQIESAYLSLIKSLVENICIAFESREKRARFKEDIPVAIAGGTTMVPGFVEKFAEALRASRFPVPIGIVSHASDPLHAVAKGALVCALGSLEEGTEVEKVPGAPAPPHIPPVEPKKEPEPKTEAVPDIKPSQQEEKSETDPLTGKKISTPKYGPGGVPLNE